jgi:hypothetical protein
MPIIGSFGAGSGKGFGFSGGETPDYIVATGGTMKQLLVIIKFTLLHLMEHLQFVLQQDLVI